jgi:hypothetical protein
MHPAKVFGSGKTTYAVVILARETWAGWSTTMRGAFRAIFVALAGLSVGSLAQAQTSDTSAICPGINGAKLPTRATFDDGSVLTVLDRSNGKVRQELVTANGRKLNSVTYNGLFVLSSDVPTGNSRKPQSLSKPGIRTWRSSFR